MADPNDFVNDSGSSASINWSALGGLTLRGVAYALVLSAVRIVLTLVQTVQNGTEHVARRIGGAVSMLTSESIFMTGAETTVANLPDGVGFLVAMTLAAITLYLVSRIMEVP